MVERAGQKALLRRLCLRKPGVLPHVGNGARREEQEAAAVDGLADARADEVFREVRGVKTEGGFLLVLGEPGGAPGEFVGIGRAFERVVAGGYDGADYSNVVDIYDADTGQWSTDTLSQGRYWLCGTTVGDKAVFAGGFFRDTGGTGYDSNVVDIYTIPEPATLALLAFGGLALIQRKTQPSR